MEATKLELTKQIMKVEDASLLEKVKALLSTENEFWDNLTEQQQKEIQLGIKQLDSGQGIPFDEFLKKHE
ncbi:MAG: hypothetical protein GY816_02580 [Cytophagales bacterium]|nr:hypothetical protein [Cytophagales bacterium]